MKNKKIISVIAILALLAFLAITIMPTLQTVIHAATRQELEQKLKQSQQSKAEAQKKVETLNKEKKSVQAELESLNIEIAKVENEVNQANAAIAENEAKIVEQQAKIDEYDDKFKERARTMYKHGSVSYLDVLFGANDFGDLMYKVQMVDRIINYDRNIIQTMTDARVELEEQKAAKELNREILVNKQEEVNAKIALRNKKISEIESDVETARAQADKEDAQMAQFRAEIARLSSSSSTPTVVSNGSMQWPSTTTKYVTSPYGWRYHPIQKRNKFHTGIDIGAASGTPVVAAESGKVIRAGWYGGYGNCVVIDHGGGITTLYGHNSSLNVSVGQKVSRGQTIALVGSTGNSTGPHIHFEVLINGQYTDPMAYVN